MPEIKFIIPQEETTNGELINLAMSEIKSDYVLVLKDTLYIPSKIILQNLATRVTESGIFCIVPWLSDKNNNTLPCVYSPSAEKSHFTVNSSSTVSDGVKTLYPFDNIALYYDGAFYESVRKTYKSLYQRYSEQKIEGLIRTLLNNYRTKDDALGYSCEQ